MTPQATEQVTEKVPATQHAPTVVRRTCAHKRLLAGALFALCALGIAPAAQLSAYAQPAHAQPAGAQAQPPSASKSAATQTPLGPPFSSLNAYQAEVLKPLQPVWDELGEVRKRKWIEIANRLPTLSDDEKNRVTQRMQEWASLTSEQRRQVRDNFSEAMGKTAAERQAQWEEYQKLSPEARAALAERAQQELRQRRESSQNAAKPPVGAAATTRPGNNSGNNSGNNAGNSPSGVQATGQ